MTEMRKETDSLGVVEVPVDKLWGAQTSDIDRKTALADTGTTSWQTTARENKSRCNGRCVQSRYLATAAPFCQ